MVTYGAVQGEAEVAECARLISLAFAGPRDKSEEWLRGGGVENLRVVRAVHGGVVACLLRIPMGQYFGGRSVAMVGIAGVAVAPEARGQGIGRTLMRECVEEIAGEGVAISTLYASTQELYRQVGYEQAGHRFVTMVPYTQLRVDRREAKPEDREMIVAGATPTDEDAIRACYARFARTTDGMLDRGEYCWKRTRQMRESSYSGFVVREPQGAIEGYVFLGQNRDGATGRHDVVVSDYAFTSARAARRIVELLGNFGSMMQECSLPGGPLHPLAHHLAQQRFRSEKKDYWMVRLTSVDRALEARGYAAGVEGSVTMRIVDGHVPSNAGVVTLSVSKGRGSVARGGKAGDSIGLDVRGLAAMYSGLLSARQCVANGWLEGDEGAIAMASSVFAGATPSMTDQF